MVRLSNILLAMLLCSLSLCAYSQADTTRHLRSDSIPGFIKGIGRGTKWLADHKIALRKTLDGSKDEAKPASILWNNDYENKMYYVTVDAAIKVSEFALLKHGNLLFYPKAEWHKNGIPLDDKKKNNLTGGVNAEFFQSFGAKWWQHPFITGSFDYKNDLIKKLGTTQTKGFLSFSGSKTLEPGAKLNNSTKALVFRYYPYSGFEHYQSLNKQGQSASMWANRLYLEWYPLSRYYYQFAQITLDYTHRSIIQDNLYGNGAMNWLSIGLNIYPDGKGNIGFGLDYSKGEDPSSNFVKTNMLALGIKLKI